MKHILIMTATYKFKKQCNQKENYWQKKWRKVIRNYSCQCVISSF